uniref:adenosine deaminase n=1 Tax=Candidatus Kentrum sp. DK TaxID=2126562 RepID=A0A450S2K5_9GAMM|nr:MAG: adenosine deaminase [Candidatus Kentron sp. DK]
MTTPEPPGNSTPGLFFVCAWNSYDAKGKLWRCDPTEEVVIDFLIRRQWEPTTDEKEANLIVVLLRDKDSALSLADLPVYSRGLGGRPKQVLYLHTAARVKFLEGDVAPWLFVGSRVSCPFEQLECWLNLPLEGKDEESAFDIKAASDEINKSILSAYAGRMHALERQDSGNHALKGRRVLDRQDVRFSRTGFRLLREGKKELSQAKFFYGLCRISDRYNQLEHDIKAKEATRGQGNYTPKDRARDAAQFELLNRYADLRSAIATRCSIGPPRHPESNVILLIDDHPERGGLAKKIAGHIGDYLPGFELWVWNPDALANHHDGVESRMGFAARAHLTPMMGTSLRDFAHPALNDLLHRREVERYASFGKIDKNFPDRRLEIQRMVEGKREEVAAIRLACLLARTHTVLVDILFENVAGGDVAAGFGIVSGMQRICRDYGGKIADELNALDQGRGDKESKWRQPEVIALSRASDPDKIQTIFRRGGGGYVSKDRLLSLPAMIARGHLAVFAATTEAHRNFRQLYNLPHETMGLLRAVTIPADLSFHRSTAEGTTNSERKDRKEKRTKAQPLAKLIAALPKADLHVHPGSCMSPEFMAIASLVMLARHDPKKNGDFLMCLGGAISALSRFWAGERAFSLSDIPVVNNRKGAHAPKFWSGGHRPPYDPDKGSPIQVERVAAWMRGFLLEQVKNGEHNRNRSRRDSEIEKRYAKFRSILHNDLNLPDYQSAEGVNNALREKPAATLFFFALGHAGLGLNGKPIREDDLLRLFILWLMAGEEINGTKAEIKLFCEEEPEIKIDLERWFWRGDIDKETWNRLHGLFYGNRSETCPHRTDSLRGNHWELDPLCPCEWSFSMQGAQRHSQEDLLSDSPGQWKNPLDWLMASGARATNLKEYLESCEYTGAEHLRHPFLIHLFAQQTVHGFVRHGILYAELRAAIGGYENKDIRFSFADACDCFRAAFGSAQRMVHEQYHSSGVFASSENWLWRGNFPLPDLFDPLKDELAGYRFPCKVSVILTGKRHKPTRTLVREAAAGAVLFSRSFKEIHTARQFAESAVGECRIVGFDLAGQEDGYPPEQFRQDYEQIVKMHIPVTVHAGENAPARFVESAILDLRARRLGHGLALADDEQLLDRARDDGICVELCPVSNFQTNTIYPHGKAGHGREYPLRRFLSEGLAVTLNTDNPVISHTNMIKECLQASYAFGEPGLSLWELLRILRLGFTNAFLTLQERRALLELADQLLLDLLSDQEIVRLLQSLAMWHRLSDKKT